MTMSLRWGDFHNHNEIGYGAGSLERSYRIAKGCLLDVYAFTPHGWWHDEPIDDPKMADYHRRGFEKVVQHWPQIKTKANVENRPGEFVALLAFEWHSSGFGDYHLLLPGDDGDIVGFEHIDQLRDYAKRTGAIPIPHHIAYAKGWRGVNWDTFDPGVSPVVDVFSEHGDGLEFDTQFPMLLHSMGGSEKSQTAMERLKLGLPVGLVASTDNHHGHPATYGEGITGLWMESFTREGVFDALRKRHVYAATGDRIKLQFHAGDAMMGDILPAASPRTFRFKVECLDGVQFIQIIKNGENALMIPGPPLRTEEKVDEFDVRIEYGWDGMKSKEVTDWRLKANVDNGELVGVCPCFAGGDGSVEKINGIEEWNECGVEWISFTSRLNVRHGNAVVLRVKGSLDASIRVSGEAVRGGENHPISTETRLRDLKQREHWSAIGNFSSPKMRIGYPFGSNERVITGEWIDDQPGSDDFYMLKAFQKNGQMAWSSPIRFRG